MEFEMSLELRVIPTEMIDELWRMKLRVYVQRR